MDDCAAVVAEAVRRAAGLPLVERWPVVARELRERATGRFHPAQRAGLINVNPAANVPKPRRRLSRRRPLDHREVEELIDAIRATSNDPDLDLLLVRFHLESGARREGALNLRLRDLDDRRATAVAAREVRRGA